MAHVLPIGYKHSFLREGVNDTFASFSAVLQLSRARGSLNSRDLFTLVSSQ